MKRLLVYLKGYIKECIFGPLFKLLEATFELIVPLVVAAIIDTGIGTGNKGYIVSRAGILIGQGKSLDETLKEVKMVVEGITARTCQLHNRTVFCGKSCYGICNRIKAFTI